MLLVVAATVPALVVATACSAARPRALDESEYASASSASVPRPPPPPPVAPVPVDSNAPPPTRIAARHILIQYMGSTRAEGSVVRTREQARAVAEDVARRLRGGADFSRMAMEFSDEPGAAQRGGALGRFGKGAMDKKFEAAAFGLRVNEISDIVETPFGFHIIQRTE